MLVYAILAPVAQFSLVRPGSSMPEADLVKPGDIQASMALVTYCNCVYLFQPLVVLKVLVMPLKKGQRTRGTPGKENAKQSELSK